MWFDIDRGEYHVTLCRWVPTERPIDDIDLDTKSRSPTTYNVEIEVRYYVSYVSGGRFEKLVSRNAKAHSLRELADLVAENVNLSSETNITTISAPQLSLSDYGVKEPLSTHELVLFRVYYQAHKSRQTV